MSDVVGHVEEVGQTLAIRDKRGEVTLVAAADVVSIRPLSAMPVRTSSIRNLEHAAALAWPGVEQQWVDGWLLRYGHGSTRRANSAVPLLPSPGTDFPAIANWYAARSARPLLAAPDRLFRLPPGVPADGENIVMARDLTAVGSAATGVTLTSRPDDDWLGLHPRQLPLDVLTAVVDGELAFACLPGAAVGRAAVTTSPDGTRWAGISAVHVAQGARRRGLARMVCESLLAWAVGHDASRAYVQVLTDNVPAITLYASMGFGEHHRSRYVSLG